MKEKERVKKCIHFGVTDKIPWQINYTNESAKHIMKKLKLKQYHHYILGNNIFEYSSLDDFFGNHITYLRNRAVNSVKEVEPNIWMDEWGVVWDRKIDKDVGIPVNCLLENMELEKLKIPNPLNEKRFAHFEPIIKANSDRYILVKFTYGLFERAWSLRGMENLMVDFIENPSFVHELFELITDFNLAIIRILAKYQIDGFYFGDDWGSQQGLLFSPDIWHEFIRSCLIRTFNQVKSQGYDVFLHSCGNISSLFDALIEIGVNVFNPFQPEVMQVENIMKSYSKKIAFYGGLSIQKTLPFRKKEEVKIEVNNRLDLAREYGGLIISPSHDMPDDIPLENILEMLAVLKSQ